MSIIQLVSAKRGGSRAGEEMKTVLERFLKVCATQLRLEFGALAADVKDPSDTTNWVAAKHAEASFELIETMLCQLNLVVNETLVFDAKLTVTETILHFICKEFLPQLPSVFFKNVGSAVSREATGYGEDPFIISKSRQ